MAPLAPPPQCHLPMRTWTQRVPHGRASLVQYVSLVKLENQLSMAPRMERFHLGVTDGWKLIGRHRHRLCPGGWRWPDVESLASSPCSSPPTPFSNNAIPSYEFPTDNISPFGAFSFWGVLGWTVSVHPVCWRNAAVNTLSWWRTEARAEARPTGPVNHHSILPLNIGLAVFSKVWKKFTHLLI